MTGRARNGLLIGAGLTVAFFAVWTVAYSAPPREDPGAIPEAPAPTATEAPAQEALDDEVEPEAGAEATEPTVVHIETPPPRIEGLSETVSRVLTARGFAEVAGFEDPSGEIPDSVVKVLAERGVTLSVADQGTAP